MYQIGNSIHIQLKWVLYRKNVDTYYQNSCRSSNSLVYYIKGGHRFTFEDTQIEASAGQVVLLPRGICYQNQALSPDTEYYQIEFDIFEQHTKVAMSDIPLVFSGISEESFSLVYRSHTQKRTGWHAVCLGELVKLLGQLSEEPVRADPVEKAMRYLQKHYMDADSVGKLAQLCSISVSSLEKGFQKRVFMTPVEYRNSLRIAHAVQLLAAGIPIEQTAVQTGFSDRYYFTRVFRRVTGLAPGAFMREYEI